MSVGYMFVRMSGPQEHRAAILEELNRLPGFVAHPISANISDETDQAWIEVIAHVTPATSCESEAEFQRRVMQTIESTMSAGSNFRVRDTTSVTGALVERFHSHKLVGPIVSPSAGVIYGRLTVDLLWDQLRRVAHAPKTLSSFAGGVNYTDPVAVCDEFSSFILQAETYFRAAIKTEDASAALPLYYSILNLAKAELILWKPSLILSGAQRIGHGMSAAHPSALIRDWSVKILQRGVFSALYEKRVGLAWPQPQLDIAAMEIFARCLEVGMEFQQSGYGRNEAVGFYHAIVTDGVASWAQLLVDDYRAVLENPLTRSRLLENYRELDLPRRDQDVYLTFGISRRRNLTRGKLLLARYPKIVSTGGGSFVSGLAHDKWLSEEADLLRPFLGTSKLDYDGVLSTSLRVDSQVGLPDDLARYIAVYLVSSLVRYRPSALNSRMNAEQAWFLAAFVRQCAVPVLHSFVNRILDTELVFVEAHRT